MNRVLLIGWLGVALLASVGMAHAQVGKSVTVVDANTIGEADLARLPGMTPASAKGIVAKRPFLSVTALDQALTAAGLSREQITALYARIFVHINLNTASKEEILLIPGVGNRMLHEFEEYRPYAALAVFHREIDKYVDDAELARLEQYVFVPIDLNSASDADILTIPGLGNRMLHEFKEYRPYDGIERFRREIAKYVSKEEVARLERYVTIGKK
ncbi:MAG TPA: helix-hairpin-helix domain-containing protein [Vicinamibacterales bacterium]|nr:helix-hairpin-helix domain-containing protein [Vicinamibacterales bacterium]